MPSPPARLGRRLKPRYGVGGYHPGLVERPVADRRREFDTRPRRGPIADVRFGVIRRRRRTGCRSGTAAAAASPTLQMSRPNALLRCTHVGRPRQGVGEAAWPPTRAALGVSGAVRHVFSPTPPAAGVRPVAPLDCCELGLLGADYKHSLYYPSSDKAVRIIGGRYRC
jgi:hypothetical protein